MSFKKDEELGVGSFYQDKTSVIQEARVFNETPISPRKCRILLTKVIYLLYTGQTFSPHEATTLFFGATKLFQHKDPALRQMVYLAIKELCPLAEDTIMVTASIMKDMQPNMEVIYRPNAIRALSRVVDPSMVQGLERFFKSAIVDPNSSISSAALVSSYQLNVAARDVVRRWGNEAQEAINAKSGGGSSLSSTLSGAGSYFGLGGGGGYGSSTQGSQGSYQVIPSSSFITQYHALGLLYLIRAGDRMAVSRLVQQLSGASGGRGGSSASHALRSPYAICMLVRYAARIADEDPNLRGAMVELLENWLRHKADMVNLEAARAICELRGVTDAELHRSVSLLQLFLSSPKATLKFAAIRTLARLASTAPNVVASCNIDMETLISDPNRSIATYAITTLLKTGNEPSVDRLMKQISTFMADISDEFKVVIVDAIRSLCLKFPAKQSIMLGFLSGVLRDEGGYEFKRAIVEAIFDMIKFVPEAKESALAHLCEFIEDCEFTKLSVRILHLLGVEGPRMPNPHKYIRYIYNRVILENAIVRAAAVASLAKFGARSNDKSLTARIAVLLRRCLDDVDDEVRDRAAMYVRVVGETTASTSASPVKLEPDTMASRLVNDDATFQLSALESQLATYVASSETEQQEPFDATIVPRVTREQARAEALRSKAEAAAKVAMAADAPKAGPSSAVGGGGAAGSSAPAPITMGQGANAASAYLATLSAIPQFKGYGALLKSSAKPHDLIESGLEYTVSVVKHIYASHIVLQFNVTNTDYEKVVLEGVEMVVTGADEVGLTEDFIIPVPSLSADTPSDVIYVSFSRPEGTYPQGLLSCTLRYTSKEWDPNTQAPEEEGYPDEYPVEDTELAVADYVEGTYVDFNKEWEATGDDNSTTDTFALTALESLDAACTTLIDLLGLSPLGGTERPSSTSVHTLQMSGLVPQAQSAGGPVKVLARARMTFSADGPNKGVTMELSVRSAEESVRDLVMGAIA